MRRPRIDDAPMTHQGHATSRVVHNDFLAGGHNTMPEVLEVHAFGIAPPHEVAPSLVVEFSEFFQGHIGVGITVILGNSRFNFDGQLQTSGEGFRRFARPAKRTDKNSVDGFDPEPVRHGLRLQSPNR